MISLIVVLGLVLSLADGQTVMVNTSRGLVQGYHANFGSNTSAYYYGEGDVFLGIPYVQAPVGNLRFAVSFIHKCTRDGLNLL